MTRRDRIGMHTPTRAYVVGSDDDWTELNNPGQFAIRRGYMSGASRAQNSIGESCANASFFGRTSSPIREKTRVAHRVPAHPPQYNRTRACIRASWARSKIMGSSYPSKGIFIRKLHELTCKLQIHVHVKKKKYFFLWCRMKCFATIILLTTCEENEWQEVIFNYFLISYPSHKLHFSDICWSH